MSGYGEVHAGVDAHDVARVDEDRQARLISGADWMRP